jgi:hypothetical protein
MGEDVMEGIELDKLIGEHVLDAVDLSTENIKVEYGEYYENCEIIKFRLDGIAYTAIEDPSDGYRSSLDKIFVSNDAQLRNIFPPVRVLIRKKNNDTLEFIDIETTKVVIEIGNDNNDDYYPSFVGKFWPENMVTNK